MIGCIAQELPIVRINMKIFRHFRTSVPLFPWLCPTVDDFAQTLLKNEIVKWYNLSHSVLFSLKRHSYNFRWSCDRWAPRRIWLGRSLGSCYDIMSPEMLVGGWFWRTHLACMSYHLYYAMNSLLGDLTVKWHLGKDTHSFYKNTPPNMKICEGQADYSKTFPPASVFWVSILSKETRKHTEMRTGPGLDLWWR